MGKIRMFTAQNIRKIPLYALILLIAVNNLSAVEKYSANIFMPEKNKMAIPAYLANVEDVKIGTNGKTVILVRDVHSLYSAQNKLAGLLEYLNKNYSVSDCYVEGFQGIMNLSQISCLADSISRKNVAGKYLKNGKISGEEFLNIINPSKINIIGIENKTEYDKNLNALRRIISSNKNILNIISSAKAGVSNLSANSDERLMIEYFIKLMDFNLDAGEFINFIKKSGIPFDEHNIDAEKYPNIKRYLRLSRLNKIIDNSKLNDEIKSVVLQLRESMPGGFKQSFDEFQKMRDNLEVTDSKFLQVISNLSSASYLNSSLSQIQVYNACADISEKIDPSVLTDELFDITLTFTRASHSSSDMLIQSLRDIFHIEKIVSCKLSNKEAVEFCNMKDNQLSDLGGILAKYSNSGNDALTSLPGLLNDCKNYYQLAIERDKIMAFNLLSAPIRNDYSVCVAGGFHSGSISSILNSKGYTVFIVSPSMDGNYSDKSYFESIEPAGLALKHYLEKNGATLRQPALPWREGHQLMMQFDLIKDFIGNIKDQNMALIHLSRLIYEAKSRVTDSKEVLDNAVIYQQGNKIILVFKDENAVVVFNFDGINNPAIEITEITKTKLGYGDVVKSIDVTSGLIASFNAKLDFFKEGTMMDFNNPSKELLELISSYKSLMGKDILTSEDTEKIHSAAYGIKYFEGAKYNHMLTDIFMEAYDAIENPENASAVLNNLYERHPEIAELIVRSTGKGKHYQMGYMLFLMKPNNLVSLFESLAMNVPDNKVGDFYQTDGFILAGVLLSSFMLFDEGMLPKESLESLYNGLNDNALKYLLLNIYQYYNIDSVFIDKIKLLIKFIYSTSGQNQIKRIFADHSDNTVALKNWVLSIINDKTLNSPEKFAIYSTHQSYKEIRDIQPSFDNMIVFISAMEKLALSLKDDFPDIDMGKFNFMSDHLNEALNRFMSGEYGLAIQAWGMAADGIDIFLKLKPEYQYNKTFLLMEFLEDRIDNILGEYILINGLTHFKSVLPVSRRKVSAKLRIIPTGDGLKLLLDSGYLSDSFSVIDQYPLNNPAFAVPRAIIVEQGVGRREHGAKLASRWKIPYVVIPHARKLLRRLAGDETNPRWVTLELGNRSSQNVLKRASADEITEETNYRKQMDSNNTESNKIVLSKPDLSVWTPIKLKNIGIEAGLSKFGIKTGRLSYMLQNGVNVKDGFGIPFGFYSKLNQENDLNAKIEKILNKPDFEAKKLRYLSEIQKMVRSMAISDEMRESILQLYRELDPNGKGIIVRSSTSDEDIPGYFTAGLYDSFPNILNEEDFIKAVLNNYASIWSERAFNHRLRHGIGHFDVYPSVLCQLMVEAVYSGVIETANEMTNNRNESAFSIAPGHGGGVDGESGEFVLNSQTGELDASETDIPYPLKESIVAKLTADDFRKLDEKARVVDKLFKMPQNIEFAVDTDGVFWATQSQNLSFSGRTQDENNVIDKKTGISLNEITKEIILNNQEGLFSFHAIKLAEIAADFPGSIHISKEQGVLVDAKDVFNVINMRVKKGDLVSITVKGENAEMVIDDITNLLNNTTLEKQYLPDNPPFTVMYVNSSAGIHGRPIERINDIARRYPDTKIIVSEMDPYKQVSGRFTELWGKQRVEFDINSTFPLKGSQYRIRATGPNVREALYEMRRLNLYEYFGNVIGESDISLRTIIDEGYLLDSHEKEAVEYIVNTIAGHLHDEVMNLELDIKNSKIAFKLKQGKLISPEIDMIKNYMFFEALSREPYAMDYFAVMINKALPNINIIITKNPFTGLANKEIIFDSYSGLQSFLANEIADELKKLSARVIIKNHQGQSALLTDIYAVVNLNIKHGDNVVIEGYGKDIEKAIALVEKILTDKSLVINSFYGDPDYVYIEVLNYRGIHLKPSLELTSFLKNKNYTSGITIEKINPDGTLTTVYNNKMGVTYRLFLPKGTRLKVSAIGADAKRAMLELQSFAMDALFNDIPDQTKDSDFNKLIKNGILLTDSEKNAIDTVIDLLKTYNPTYVKFLLDERRIDFSRKSLEFASLNLPQSITDNFFNALFREPTARDYLFRHLYDNLKDLYNLDFQVNNDKQTVYEGNLGELSIQKDWILFDHIAVFAHFAHKIADAMKQFSSTVTISNTIGQTANATDIIGLVKLGLKEDDKFYIKAEGKDAVEAVTQLQNLFQTPLFNDELYVYDPEFLIFVAKNKFGLHSKTVARINNLVKRYDAQVHIEEIVQDDVLKMNIKNGIVTKHSNLTSKGARFKVTATGSQAKEAMIAVQLFALMRNLGDKDEIHALSLDKIVSRGSLLTKEEKATVDNVINIIVSNVTDGIESLNISLNDNTIGFMGKDKVLHPISLDKQMLDDFFYALKREPLSEDYLLLQIDKKASGLKVNLLLPPTSKKEPENKLQRQVMLGLPFGFSAYQAHALRRLLKDINADVEINRVLEAGGGPYSISGVDIRDLSSVLSLALKKGESIKVSARGKDAEKAVNIATLFFRGETDESKLKYKISPKFLMAVVRNPSRIDFDTNKPLLELINVSGVKIKAEIIDRAYSGKEDEISDVILTEYDDISGMSFNEIASGIKKGFIIKLSAVGDEAQKALISVQRLFNESLLYIEPAEQRWAFDSAVKTGQFLSIDEKSAIDFVISALSKNVPEYFNGLAIDIPRKRVGYIHSDNRFVIINLSLDVINRFFNGFLRDTYAEDYFFNGIKNITNGKRFDVIMSEDESDIDLRRNQKSIVLLEHEGIFANQAKLIELKAKSFLSKIQISADNPLSDDGIGEVSSADAVDFLSLIKLNIKKGDRFAVTAIGPDSKQAVEEIEKILTTPFLASDVFDSTPEFLIVTPRSWRGIHVSSGQKIFEIIEKFNADVSFELIDTQTSKDGITRDVVLKQWGNVFDLPVDSSITKGSRLKIKAQGNNAKQVLFALRELFLHSNFNEPDDPMNEKLSDIIENGQLLSFDEKNSLDSIINIVNTLLPQNAKSVLFVKKTEEIRIITHDNKLIFLKLPKETRDLFFKALNREPYAGDYLIKKMGISLDNVNIKIINSNEMLANLGGYLISEFFVADMKILNNLGLHEGILPNITGASKEFKGTQISLVSKNKFSSGVITAKSDEIWHLITLSLLKGDNVIITTTGPEAEEAIEYMIRLLNNRFNDPNPMSKDTDLSSDVNISFFNNPDYLDKPRKDSVGRRIKAYEVIGESM